MESDDLSEGGHMAIANLNHCAIPCPQTTHIQHNYLPKYPKCIWMLAKTEFMGGI